MVLAQLGGEMAVGWGDITATPSTCREVVGKTELGSSQRRTVRGQETMGVN